MIIYKKIKRVSLLLALSFISLGMMTACTSSDNNPAKPRNKPSHLVEASIVDLKSVSHEQILSGTMEATTSVRLHNEESGLIKLIPFHEGDMVKQGTVLIALDSDIIKAELDKAIAQHQQASIDYKRLKKLLPKKLASEEEVARSLTTLNIAKAEQQLQQLRMDKTQIKAPFDGVISQRNNEPGDAVNAHSHILSLIKPDDLLIKVNVSDQWLSLINKGDAMQLTIDALGDKEFTAYIERIHPSISATTRKGIIELALRPIPDQARAGQMARVHFKSPATERLVIPGHSIHHDIDGAFAYLILADKEGKKIARQSRLKKGLQFGEWTEIIEGIQPGDQLITRGFLGLRDGKAVTIVEQKTGTEDNRAGDSAP
ncbi:MAG: efflux RND transporter periplasmic adaptor subunit [Gammaproteobacteria bacterium]|nr:efflux RND transporter periplasmic adaptor subunit [Gammaproteobacteria bacterium]